MKFDTKVYHPNISSQTGAICLDILKDNWTPVLTLKTSLISLQSLLFDAQPNDPQDAEVAKHYIADRKSFDATAREWTLKYANGKSLQQDDDEGLDKNSIKKILDMGFDRAATISSLRKFGGDETKAIEFLLAQ
jgi:ubiquitin-conjugating enzyme (huntingtin interacting protein 2)